MSCQKGLTRNDLSEKDIKYQEELFSVSTQWDYLYTMGKIAIKYDINYKFGVHVMSDLIGLLSLFCGENSYTANRAKFYIAVALTKADHYNDAKTLLNFILPMAQKPSLKDKIKAQLEICETKLKSNPPPK